MKTIPEFVDNCVQQVDGGILLVEDIWEVACKLFPENAPLGKKMRSQGQKALVKKVRTKHGLSYAKGVYVPHYGRAKSGWKGYQLTDEISYLCSRLSESNAMQQIRDRLIDWCDEALVPCAGASVKTEDVWLAALAAFEHDEDGTIMLHEMGQRKFVSMLRVAAGLPYSRLVYFKDVKGTRMGWKGYALNSDLTEESESGTVEAVT